MDVISQALAGLTYASVNSSSAHPTLGNRGAFAHVVSPGGRTFAILSRPGGWAFCVPRGDPRAFDTHVLESAMGEFSGKDEAFVEQWLVHQGLEKLVDVLMVCFLNFGYFFIYLKYLMLKTKYKGINIIRSN